MPNRAQVAARMCVDELRQIGQSVAQRRHAQHVHVRGGRAVLAEAACRDVLPRDRDAWPRSRAPAPVSAASRPPARPAAPRARAAAWPAPQPAARRSRRERSCPCPADSNAPLRVAFAPVNAPRSWPNNSLSIRLSASAAAVDGDERLARARRSADARRARRALCPSRSRRRSAPCSESARRARSCP